MQSSVCQRTHSVIVETMSSRDLCCHVIGEACGVRWKSQGLILLPDTQEYFVQTKYTSYGEIFCTMQQQRM